MAFKLSRKSIHLLLAVHNEENEVGPLPHTIRTVNISLMDINFQCEKKKKKFRRLYAWTLKRREFLSKSESPEFIKENTDVDGYIKDFGFFHIVVQQKLAQCGKAAIPQLENK